MDQHEIDLEKIFELSDEQLDLLERTALVAIVQESDSPESFFAFYEVITGIPCPEHCKQWLRDIYDFKAQDKGMVEWAFRGSWKTTTLTILFTAYRIGKEPERANLILQDNDKSAADSTAAVARIIEHHQGFRDCFPNVIPDKARGWGAMGYEVRRSDLTDAEWTELCAARKDPTLLGLGYSSGSVIGRHPDGVMFIDDIHDEENSSSATERAKVVRILTGTILPLIVEDVTREPGQRLVTWEIAVGTPWHEEDAYHYLRNTGEFGFASTPIMRPAEPDEKGVVLFEADPEKGGLQGRYKLLWEERFPKEVIVSLYNKSGKREFGRMYLLDLTAALDTGFRFQSYPHKEIDLKWITCAGVDYASTIEIRGKTIDPKNRSKFAHCIGMKLPTGGAVVYDGFLGHVSQLEAENKTIQAHGLFENFLMTGVEMNGKGEEFFAILQRHPRIRGALFPYWTGRISKRDRLERGLSPYLEMGLIKISDADTPFLNELRKSLQEFPHGNLDVLDALYGFAQTIPDVLQLPDVDLENPDINSRRRKRRENPFIAFGSN